MGAPDLCDYFFVNGWTAERACAGQAPDDGRRNAGDGMTRPSKDHG